MASELSPSDTFMTYKKLLHIKLQSQNYPHAEGESHSIFLHTAVQSPDPKHSIYIPPAPKGMVPGAPATPCWERIRVPWVLYSAWKKTPGLWTNENKAFPAVLPTETSKVVLAILTRADPERRIQ